MRTDGHKDCYTFIRNAWNASDTRERPDGETEGHKDMDNMTHKIRSRYVPPTPPSIRQSR